MTMKQYIGAFIGILAVAICGYLILQWSQGELAVGADAVTPIAGQTYTLAGSGVSSSDTSFTLTSFTITQNGYKIQDSDLSDTFYITLEPGSRARQEIISCTTVVQNADNTATISGCVRGLSPVTPYSASSTLQFAHSGGSIVIFSNPPQLYNQAAFKDNDETVTGSWLFPTPLGSFNAATKEYVDGVVTGGVVSNDRMSVAGTAGETVATGTLVYFNGTDQEWYKVNSNSTTTFEDRFIGLTQGAGTNGNAITRGILLKGRDTTQTGMTAGSVYYANTTGGISIATSAQPVGVAEDTNIFYFDPRVIGAVSEMGNNTFTATNTFSGVTQFNSLITGHASTAIRVYTSTTTWSKPAGLEYVTVWVCGAGGNGGAGSASSDSGGGGGAGGCGFEMLDSTELAATSTILVGVSTGAGGVSSFSSFCTANSGTNANADDPGTGGTASSCDINLTGQGGSGGVALSSGDLSGAAGGSSHFGGGGNGGLSPSGNGGAGGTYGGGGGGGAGSASSGNGSGGTGAQGVVIVTEYY